MSQALNRIGKSLIKYFKPVRVAQPHFEDQGQSARKSFRLFNVKKAAEETQSKKQPAAPKKTEEPLVSDLAPLPEKPPGHWLELVVYLLGACKKVSDKMRRKSGIATYQTAAQQRGREKLMAVGTIVDTTPLYDGELDPKLKKTAV